MRAHFPEQQLVIEPMSNPAVTNHVDMNLLLVLLSATFQVLPNGNILDCLSSMRKDNTGLLGLSLSCSIFSFLVPGLFIAAS